MVDQANKMHMPNLTLFSETEPHSVQLLSQDGQQSISNSLANGVGILDFWQKPLKHPSNSLANDLAKYDNLAKTLSHRAYMATWKRAWQILSLLACWVLTTKIKFSSCLHAAYCLFFSSFCQVPNSKLLEIELFFTWQIVLRVGKSQDLPSRIWQTFENAYLSNKQVPEK